MVHTIATTFLPRSYCQTYAGYPRVSFLAFNRMAPLRIEHATLSLSWSEKHPTLCLQHWPPNSSDLNPVDYSIWSVLKEKVYRSRIANVDELKTCQIDEWERFD